MEKYIKRLISAIKADELDELDVAYIINTFYNTGVDNGFEILDIGLAPQIEEVLPFALKELNRKIESNKDVRSFSRK